MVSEHQTLNSLDEKVQKEIKLIKSYYEKDKTQHRFSALITGEVGSGKSYLIKTARKPIHIDSFDYGGTKCLKKEISNGEILADTFYETEDPFKPSVFAEWKRRTDDRFRNNYYDHLGTYVLDSATAFSESIMNFILKDTKRVGKAPLWNKDYVPQKFYLINYIKKLMSIPCDFILTGHLRAIEEIIGMDTKTLRYRFLATGQAEVTIPALFDELYVMIKEETSRGSEFKILIESQGKYLARSRLKGGKKMKSLQDADIGKLFKSFRV